MYKANNPYTPRETSTKWKLNSHGKKYSLCTYLVFKEQFIANICELYVRDETFFLTSQFILIT